MKYKIIILMLLASVQLLGQYTNVKINGNYVSGEVWVAMNPKNINNLVAGTIGQIHAQSNMVFFYSLNGGYNWSGGTIYSTLAQPGSDPVVVVDTNGYFYYISVGNWLIPPPNADKLLCNKSTNGGADWDNGVTFGVPAPKMNDMPMACVDLSNSPYTNNIYVTWTLIDSMQSTNPLDSSYVYFSSSTNQGQTFSTPKRISRIAGKANWDNSTPEGPVPCTGTNGEIYVTYPYNEQVLFTRSLDGGNTWLSNEIVVSNQVGGWSWYHSPVIACDLSNSPFRGNVYICFSDLRNGVNDRDIFFVKSTDGGEHWSAPLRVNNDGQGHTQQLPWICVDEVTGYIWMVFYDGRNYSTGSMFDTYVARSTNGGNSFQNVKVSSSPSLANYVWLGDYISIAARNNKVRPVWTNSNGFAQANIWTAIIDTFTIGIQSISSETPSSYALYQNYPNPFNSSTKIKFQMKQKGFAEIKLYDVTGRLVRNILKENINEGTYETGFEAADLPSGIYFYSFYANGNIIDTRKMVLIK